MPSEIRTRLGGLNHPFSYILAQVSGEFHVNEQGTLRERKHHAPKHRGTHDDLEASEVAEDGAPRDPVSAGGDVRLKNLSACLRHRCVTERVAALGAKVARYLQLDANEALP